MKEHHIFRISILALLVLVAFGISLYPQLISNCSSSSGTPHVTVAVSSDTLTAVAGTRLPLRLSVVNEENTAVSGGTVYLTVTHNVTGTLVYNQVVKADVSLLPHGVATSTVFWDIPARLYPSVYTIKPLFVLNGLALRGTLTSHSSPFGNSARVSVSGDKKGVFPSAYIRLPQYAQYSEGQACTDKGLVSSIAMAVGGLGTLMLLLGMIKKRP